MSKIFAIEGGLRRPIEFRGYCGEKKAWVYGSLIVHGNEVHISTDQGVSEVFPETVGQFTGLYDKNEDPIYEDDLIKCSGNVVTTVVWNKSATQFELMRIVGLSDDGVFGDELEIVGNRFHI